MGEHRVGPVHLGGVTVRHVPHRCSGPPRFTKTFDAIVADALLNLVRRAQRLGYTSVPFTYRAATWDETSRQDGER